MNYVFHVLLEPINGGYKPNNIFGLESYCSLFVEDEKHKYITYSSYRNSYSKLSSICIECRSVLELEDFSSINL